MNRSTIALSCLLFVSTWVPSTADERAKQPQKPSAAEARAAAEKWLNGLGAKGLVINEKRAKNGFVVKPGRGAIGPVTSFRFQHAGWWVSVTFKGVVNEKTPLTQLRKQFWHVALDRLPTPGLELSGWEVRPQTPVSSFSKGVEFLAYGDGKIKLRVKTKFFALYGRDPSVRVPADAPSPKGSYFQIRKSFPLDLTLEAPFSMPK